MKIKRQIVVAAVLATAMAGGIVSAETETVTRDGMTVRFAACEKCDRRMRLEADGLNATVNVSRLGDDRPDEPTLEARKRAMAERAFRLMAAARDALRSDAPDRPTMGWSSWNSFGVNISEEIILSIARAMATNGLKAAGYRYVNIDDGFFWGHGKDGRLQIHPERFPHGLKPTVDGIHALGLKAGIYSDAGSETCGSIWGGDKGGHGAGLYGHDEADCRMHFNELGFDFIKVDFCGGQSLALDERTRYTEIARAIAATGRKDVRLNVCRWAFPGTWVADVAGSWRTTGDIRATWGSIRGIVSRNVYLSPYMSLGHYNDLDMLEVGQRKGEFKSCFGKDDTGLTEGEETAHFGLWCLFSSPLLIGCDVRKMSAATIALVTNPYLLMMNQNDLGVGPVAVWREGDACVFAKDAVTRFGTARFVTLYNPDDRERTFKFPFAAVELAGRVAAFDLVERADIGEGTGEFTMTVPAHSARFYRFDGERRLAPTRYEAEDAYLTGFQEICDANVARTARVVRDPKASGGAYVTNLGWRPINDIVWREMRIETRGHYELRFRLRTPEKRSFTVFMNDEGFTRTVEPAANGEFATVAIETGYDPGVYTVRMVRQGGQPLPDVDCFDLVRLPDQPANRAAGESPAVRYVDEFDLSGAVSGYGYRTVAKSCVKGTPLTLKGKRYYRGFGDHPESALAFASDGRVTAFDALVGLDEASVEAQKKSYGWAQGEFRVWADGKIVWRSGAMGPEAEPKAVHVDLAGAKEIVLESTTGKDWTACDAVFADWADARFTCAPGAKLERIADPKRFAQLGILTPPEKPEPQINGADIWGVRPGHPVIFRVATSGVRPMRFTAKNLPAGVTLDAGKGILGGVAPSAKGNYDIEVTAENAKGRATRTIRLAVGDTIALTPPMGWNSWNVWCYRLTQEHAMASAKAMHDSGLGDHGWSYVNLDDWWMMNNSGCERVEARRKDYGGREDVIGPARDAEGRINPNRSFPDMKALTDYIHSFGFKAGLYSSPGTQTCGRCEGSYGHEMQDATRWAEWGFDYVKYDWCSYTGIFEKENGIKRWEAIDKRHPGYEKPYRLMGECLRKQPRDILYSFCQYGMGRAQEWGAEAGGSCWRSWDDLKDAWVWMEMAVEGRLGGGEYHKYNRPGWWADPDMMIVGRQYSFAGDHMTYLTPNEQYTHVSLWAMVGSPLLTGCDLSKLDGFTRSLLVNDWVIAISQDRLGQTAHRLRHTDAESVWVRPLANGDNAVALLNRSPISREIKVTFDELGLRGAHYLRDCWTGRCEGRRANEYSAEVPPHATKLVRIRANDCPKCD